MEWQYHEAISRKACMNAGLDEKLSAIIVRANVMQDGYHRIRDYFPRLYRIAYTISTHFIHHERHFTKFPWETSKKAEDRARAYMELLQARSLDMRIPDEEAAVYEGMNEHAREDMLAHRPGEEVVSFFVNDVFRIPIGYSHSRYANDSPDSRTLKKAEKMSTESLRAWAEARALV